MVKTKTALPDGVKPGPFSKIMTFSKKSQIGPGIIGLALVLASLSFLCTYEWSNSPKIYALDDIANINITSPVAFTFNDEEATIAKRNQVRKAQPLLCVLDLQPVERIRNKVDELFKNTNKTTDQRQRDTLRQTISEELGEEISERMFAILRNPAIQTLVRDELLPWIEYRLSEGVIQNNDILINYSSGVVIRDTEGEIVATQADVSDISRMRHDMELHLQRINSNKLANGLILTLLNSYITPTLHPDFEATVEHADTSVKEVRPIMRHVMKGEIIVRHGEKIGPGHMTKLRALWNTELVKFNGIRFTGILLTSLIVSGGLFFSPSGKAMGKIEQKELLFIGFVIVFFTILAKVFAIVGSILAASSPYFPIGAHVYALPVAGATLMLTTFSARRYFITSMLLSLFCTLAANGNLPLFLFYFLSALFGSWITNKAQNRKEIVKALPKLLCALIPLWCATSMYQNGETANMGVEFMAVLLGSFLSLILTFAMPPLIEIIFGFTTKFSLLELMNQEHPVLRQLMLDAPGTYHHCLVVSNMAELAAKAMDANSLLCKVGALYHDIGKVEKPLYFIENQFRGINPHDNLSPTMSALVLISHVKSGAELATQAHLGKEIIDIIQEHHGTRLVQYFYQKALSANIKVQVEDFCYPGPKPSSTESAIIMLADVIEASSRTLDNPTPSRIKAHVHRMIRVILAEGQLSNVEMSFRDLDRLEESFTLILTGMFHKRIEYPGKHPVKAASDTAPGAVPSASSTSLGTSPGTSTSTSPDASPNASPKTSPDASPKVSPETLPETTNAAAAGSMPGHTEIPSHQLPVQPMEFKPHVSKLDKAQMEKEQLRINIRDYNDAKWLNLEENVHEITILNNNLALLSDQKDLQKK